MRLTPEGGCKASATLASP